MAERIEIEITSKDSTDLKSVSTKLKNLGNDLRGIGGQLNTIFTRPLADLGRFIAKNDEVVAALEPVKTAWTDLGNQMAVSLIPTIQAVTPALISLAGSLGKIVAAFSALPPGAQQAIIGFIFFLAAIGPVLIVIGQTITAIGGLVSAFSSIAGVVGPIVGPVLATLGGIIAGITLPVWLLIAAIGLLIATIVIFGKQAWENLKRICIEWYKLLDAIKDYFVRTFTDIWEGLVSRLVDIKNYFVNFDWRSIGTRITDGIKNGIVSGVNNLISAARDAAMSAYNAAKAALGIRSPSVLFEGIGTQMMRGMALGISGGSSMPVNATRSVVGAVSSPSVSASRGGGGMVINLTYSPAVSLIDRAEAEQKLMPYIEAAVRRSR